MSSCVLKYDNTPLRQTHPPEGVSVRELSRNPECCVPRSVGAQHSDPGREKFTPILRKKFPVSGESVL